MVIKQAADTNSGFAITCDSHAMTHATNALPRVLRNTRYMP